MVIEILSPWGKGETARSSGCCFSGAIWDTSFFFYKTCHNTKKEKVIQAAV
jgi:hypothetical protein